MKNLYMTIYGWNLWMYVTLLGVYCVWDTLEWYHALGGDTKHVRLLTKVDINRVD